MIFYFSGTGNSLYVARKTADQQNEKLFSIADCIKNKQFEYSLAEGESVGFVFPVYFYGIPTIVSDFIRQLNLQNYHTSTYTFTIFTCGGSIGNANGRLKRLLKHSHFHLDSAFTVVMPDNYIIMFNLLPPEEKRKEILLLAEPQISMALQHISKKDRAVFILKKGPLPCFMTFANYPFYLYGRSTKPFHSTSECTSCGLCERICPSGMIHLQNKRPVWDKGKCTQCLACIHHCPEKAIQHGKKTYKRGRYVNPNL